MIDPEMFLISPPILSQNLSPFYFPPPQQKNKDFIYCLVYNSFCNQYQRFSMSVIWRDPAILKMAVFKKTNLAFSWHFCCQY